MSLQIEENGAYQVLAEHGDVSVYRCDRGCLHLQFGNMNIRLEDEEFMDLAAVMEEAILRMNGPRTKPRYGRVQ